MKTGRDTNTKQLREQIRQIEKRLDINEQQKNELIRDAVAGINKRNESKEA